MPRGPLAIEMIWTENVVDQSANGISLFPDIDTSANEYGQHAQRAAADLEVSASEPNFFDIAVT